MKKITLKKDPSPRAAIKAKKKELKTVVKTEKKTAKATAKKAKIDAKLNMTPEEFKERRKVKRGRALFGAVSGLATGGLVAYETYHSKLRKKHAQDWNANYGKPEPTNKQLRQWNREQKK